MTFSSTFTKKILCLIDVIITIFHSLLKFNESECMRNTSKKERLAGSTIIIQAQSNNVTSNNIFLIKWCKLYKIVHTIEGNINNCQSKSGMSSIFFSYFTFYYKYWNHTQGKSLFINYYSFSFLCIWTSFYTACISSGQCSEIILINHDRYILKEQN